MQLAKRTKVSTSGNTSVEVLHNQPKDVLVERTLATWLCKHLTWRTLRPGLRRSLPREVWSSDTT